MGVDEIVELIHCTFCRDVETGSEEYESEGQLGDEQGARAEPESAVTNGADIFGDNQDQGSTSGQWFHPHAQV